MTSVLDLAKLSAAAYQGSNDVGEWLCEYSWADPNGFFAAYYVRKGVSVLSIRGTDTPTDWIDDLNLVLAKIPDQIPNAKGAFEDTVRKFKPEKLYLTGHSLGGGLASAIGAIYNKPTITFNGPGMKRSLKRIEASKVPTKRLSTIINYRSEEDPVSIATGPQLGLEISVPLPQIVKPNVVDLPDVPKSLLLNPISYFLAKAGKLGQESLANTKVYVKYLLEQHSITNLITALDAVPLYQRPLIL